MSFAGILTFKKNLEAVMDSEAFKKASDADRLRMGGALMRSSYGACGISGIKPLLPENDSVRGKSREK